MRVAGVVKDVSEGERLGAARIGIEELVARVFAASPYCMAIARVSDGKLLAVNAEFECTTGFRMDEVVGRSVFEINLWEDPGQRDRLLRDLRSGVEVRNRPVRMRGRGGRPFSGAMSAFLMEHDGERLIVGIVHDLTQTERLERRAHTSERMFGALFESSPEPITLHRVSDGLRLAANSAWERASGFRREQAVNRPIDETTIWHDETRGAEVLARVLAEGRVSNVEARLVRADGGTLDVLISAVRIEMDGEPCVLWSWRDMTERNRLAQQVRQSDRKFMSLFETSPVALVVSRAMPGGGGNDRIVEINDAALTLIGVPREEAVGSTVRALLTWVDTSAVEALRDRAQRGEQILAAPVQFDRRDGKRVEVLISGSVIEIEGDPHFVISLLDVSEQRAVERERSIVNARYRQLFDAAMDGIVIMSPDWTFLDLNPAACAFAGYERAELIGKPITAVFGREELELNPIRPDTPWRLVERELTRKDGTHRAVEGQAGPMPDGNILVIARDISERKRHESMLMNIARGVSAELGAAFFQSLVEHLVRGLEADLAFVAELQPGNERFRTLAFVADGAIRPNFDYPVEGSPCATALAKRGTVIYASGVAELFPLDAGLRKHGVQGYVGTSLHGADGSPIGILVVMHRTPVERGQFWGSMIEIFGARAGAEIERSRAEALVRRTNESLERTVRERTGELEHANRDLESYNYSISHDLRQPLNAIAGFAELLRDVGADAPAADREKFLGEIERNAERMDRMISSLLQLSRAGRGPIVKTEVDMRSLVDSVLDELSVSTQLKARVEIGELPSASGDAVLLRQVWSNLIGNALKYSSHKSAPRIRIWGRRRAHCTEFGVSDNGVGFDMRHVERLFEAFHRLPSAASFEGSGVGLAIVQRIVRRHDGQLTPESVPGEGATFRFSLPA